MSTYDTCPRCGHIWHGLPCIRHTNGTPCRCETAWEEAA